MVVLIVFSLFLGSRIMPLPEVAQALLDGPGSADDSAHVVWHLRVPRTILALLVGAALGMAGAIAQAWTRNPLADPGFIGITAGAACAMAVGMTLGITAVGGRLAMALVGAAVAASIVLLVSRASLDPLTVILVGVGVSAALQALTTAMALQSSAVLDGMRQWNLGSTQGRGAEDIAVAAAGLIVGGLVAALVARPLDLLSLGEEASVALGSSPTRVRLLAVLAVVLLAGAATAAVGPLVFVGFAAPHLVRVFTGPELRRMLLPTALVGAAVALAADIVGRVVMRPGELEMSIVMAVVGAPIVIWAVRRFRSLKSSVEVGL